MAFQKPRVTWGALDAFLPKELRDTMVDGCNEIVGGRSFEELDATRDRGIVAILKAATETKNINNALS